MNEPLILAFDLGTQSVRALLVTSKGEILYKVQKEFYPPYLSKRPGWAEQKPEYYWGSLCETSLALKAKAGSEWKNILGVTCTTIRDTCLCLDKDLKPLRDAILWLDERKAENLGRLPFLPSMLICLTGLSDKINLQRRVSHCNWIAANEKEIWEKTYKFVFLSTWLNYKFSGSLADSTASIIGHIPFDYKRRAWQKPGDLTRALWEVKDEMLFNIVEPGTIIGSISEKVSEDTGITIGVPYIVSGSDKGCETLGLSCVTEESAALSFGTTATVQLTTRRYLEPSPFMPAYPAVVPGYYNPEIEIYRGYWLLSWFKHFFYAKEIIEADRTGIKAERLLDKRLNEVSAGCDGLVMQPYFSPGLNKIYARGAIIGLTDAHTPVHIYRSIIEGINFALMEGLRDMEKRGRIRVKKLFVAGGGSQSPEVCQITASQFGLPVYRTQTHEVSALGAALAAFVAKGVFSSFQEGIESMVHIKDEFLPNKKENALYEHLYKELFFKVFDKLSPLYAKIPGGG